MNFPKIVIISNGEQTAALIDGVMYGQGVGKIRFKSDGATSTIDITDIDGSSFKGRDEADFRKAWKRFSNELCDECKPLLDSLGGQVFHEDDTGVG